MQPNSTHTAQAGYEAGWNVASLGIVANIVYCAGRRRTEILQEMWTDPRED